MMEPGSGERRDASWRAASSCFSSGKRWKKDEAWMAEMRPCRGVREVNMRRSDGREAASTSVIEANGAWGLIN